MQFLFYPKLYKPIIQGHPKAGQFSLIPDFINQGNNRTIIFQTDCIQNRATALCEEIEKENQILFINIAIYISFSTKLH